MRASSQHLPPRTMQVAHLRRCLGQEWLPILRAPRVKRILTRISSISFVRSCPNAPASAPRIPFRTPAPQEANCSISALPGPPWPSYPTDSALRKALTFHPALIQRHKKRLKERVLNAVGKLVMLLLSCNKMMQGNNIVLIKAFLTEITLYYVRTFC